MERVLSSHTETNTDCCPLQASAGSLTNWSPTQANIGRIHRGELTTLVCSGIDLARTHMGVDLGVILECNRWSTNVVQRQ